MVHNKEFDKKQNGVVPTLFVTPSGAPVASISIVESNLPLLTFCLKLAEINLHQFCASHTKSHSRPGSSLIIEGRRALEAFHQSPSVEFCPSREHKRGLGPSQITD